MWNDRQIAVEETDYKANNILHVLYSEFLLYIVVNCWPSLSKPSFHIILLSFLVVCTPWLPKLVMIFFQNNINTACNLLAHLAKGNMSFYHHLASVHRYFLLSFISFAPVVSEENILKNRPIRNKNCLWRPCLLMDWDEI
jgi:hypothetical protein